MVLAYKFLWKPEIPCFRAGIQRVLFIAGRLLFIAGFIFSLVMLIDCLKRPASKFLNPLTKKGEYDKLIWTSAIVLSLWFYCIGAIVYFFVVMKAKPEKSE